MKSNHMFSFRSLKIFFSILAVILLLIFFGRLGWLGAPKNIAFKIIEPFASLFFNSHEFLSGQFATLFTLGDLIEENKNLRAHNLALIGENSALREKEEENKILRRRLELPLEKRPESEIAQIIGSSSQDGGYLIVNKGKNGGISDGMFAVTSQNFLVGKVVEANLFYSKILLITSNQSIVNVLSQETRVKGVAKGNQGLSLIMEMIPIAEEIKEGETVITSGLNDSAPQGIILGVISKIIFRETEIFKKAEIRPAVDFESLEKIFILKNPDSS